MAPTWVPEGATSPQDGPTTAQDGSRRSQDGPKTAQDDPKTTPRPPQDGPRRPQDGPKRPQDAPRAAPGASWTPLGYPRPPGPPRDTPRDPPGPSKMQMLGRFGGQIGSGLESIRDPPETPKMQMLERFGDQIVSGLGSIRALVFIKIRQPQRRVISSTNQSSSSSLKLAVLKFQSQVPVARRTFTRGLARIPSSIFPGHLQNYAPCSPIPCLLLHRFSLGSPLGDIVWQILVPPPPPPPPGFACSG